MWLCSKEVGFSVERAVSLELMKRFFEHSCILPNRGKLTFVIYST